MRQPPSRTMKAATRGHGSGATNAALARLGAMALVTTDPRELVTEAANEVRQAVGADFSRVMQMSEDGATFSLVAGSGWSADTVGSTVVPAGIGSDSGFTLIAGGPTIVSALGLETRFEAPDYLLAGGVSSSVSVVIPGASGAWGILALDSKSLDRFGRSDADFLMAAATLLGSAIQRRDIETHLSVIESILAETSDAVIILRVGQREGPPTVKYVNPAFCELAGCDADQFPGPLPDSLASLLGTSSLGTADKTRSLDVRNNVETVLTSLLDGHVLGVVRRKPDTPPRKRSANQERASESHRSGDQADQGWAKAAFDHAGVGLLMLDLRGVVVATNRALNILTCYPEGSLEGLPFASLIHEEHRAKHHALLTDQVNGLLDRFAIRRTIRTVDGSTRDAHVVSTLIRSEYGKPSRIVVSVTPAPVDLTLSQSGGIAPK